MHRRKLKNRQGRAEINVPIEIVRSLDWINEENEPEEIYCRIQRSGDFIVITQGYGDPDRCRMLKNRQGSAEINIPIDILRSFDLADDGPVETHFLIYGNLGSEQVIMTHDSLEAPDYSPVQPVAVAND